MSLDPRLLEQHAIDVSLSIIDRHIVGGAHRRFVRGDTISSARANSNGHGFSAAGLVDDGVRIPLLLEHDPMRPLGKIICIRTIKDRVEFDAELLNSGRLAYADQVWGLIMLRDVVAVSVGPRNLGAPVRGGVFECWKIDEISIVSEGADLGAALSRCWERAHVIHHDRPSEIQHWRASC